MALPSSRTSQVARSTVLEPLPVLKRRHNSSSSESLSSTVKVASTRKTPGNRLATQAPHEENQDKRVKKRSKLTGLPNHLFVVPQRSRRTTGPVSGASSRINIEERRARATGASNTPTIEIVSSSDSEGDDELVEQALQLDPNEPPFTPSEMSTPAELCNVSVANAAGSTATGIVPSHSRLRSEGSTSTGSEHQFHTSNSEVPDVATPTGHDDRTIATLLEEEERSDISRAGDQTCDEDMRDSQGGIGSGDSDMGGMNTWDIGDSDAGTDSEDTSIGDSDAKTEDFNMFDIEASDDEVSDDEASDNEASDDATHDDVTSEDEPGEVDAGTNSEDDKMDGTGVAVIARKEQLLSLVKDIQEIQKQPQNSPCTKGDIQIILKHTFRRDKLTECSPPKKRGDHIGHMAGHGKRRQSLLPAHQTHDRLELKTEVRKFTMTLLKRNNKKSPFNLPSTMEFTQFEAHKIGGPTRKKFRVQLTGSLTCRWNRRAAEVFSEAYIKENGSRFKHEELAACFKIHLRTLKNQCERIKAGLTKTQADIKHRSVSARRTRRQRIARRRGEVLERYGELQDIATHLNKLGVDGMSGDESDHSGGHRRYVMRKLSWRSDEVTAMLRVLDALALVSHWTCDGRPRSGKFPHVRIPSDMVENRNPVRNLPCNFYREDWLNRLDKYERRELNMGKPFNLTMPDRLLRLAFRYKDASDPQSTPLPIVAAQRTPSKSHGIRSSGQRLDPKPSKSKRTQAQKAMSKKRTRNSDNMDVDD